ncbi:MAG TPA: hypothetical protein VJ768_03825, partial [Anaerolineales bacterium]|nr:hypothetical protein [Anaerolineales bacterium]
MIKFFLMRLLATLFAIPISLALFSCGGGIRMPGDLQESATAAPTREALRTPDRPVVTPTPEPTASDLMDTPDPTTSAPVETAGLVTPSVTPTPEREPDGSESIPPIVPDNLDRLSVIYHLSPGGGSVYSVAISPDSRLLAAGTSSGSVTIYSLLNGELLVKLPPHSGAVNTLEFSPDGLLLASGSDDRTVRLWDARDFTQIREISASLEGRVLDVKFSPTEPLIAIGGHLCFWSLRNIETGILRRTFI